MSIKVELFSIYLQSQTGLFFSNNQRVQKMPSANISSKDIPHCFQQGFIKEFVGILLMLYKKDYNIVEVLGTMPVIPQNNE